jgi:hypothetical protein
MARERRIEATSLPRVAVMYEPEAFSPFEINEAAQGLCELVWVTGWASPLPSALERLLPRLGAVVDAEGLEQDAVVAELHRIGVGGIVVFSDVAQEPAAAIAATLGLPFHSPQTALRLRDKLAQREALRAGGLPSPAVAAVSSASVSSRAESDRLGMSWPAVLKPRRGSGGRQTSLVSGPEDLLAHLDEASDDEQFILEEYLPDSSDRIDSPAADMVSVELVVADGVARHVAVTGRFPLVARIMENGSFLPSHLNSEESAAVIETAGHAAAALGVERGVLHVEVKLTPAGPRIIEVNGRVGGIIPTHLASVGGPPLLTWALRLALGLDIPPFTPIASGSPVAFYYAWLPPVGEFVVRDVERFEAVRAMPEVDRAWLSRKPGDRVSSREGGMFGHLAVAYGTVATHDELWSLAARLEATPSFLLEPGRRPVYA